MAETFETKDSGERAQFESGMVRDTETGKTRFDLALDGPLPWHLLHNAEDKHDAFQAFSVWIGNADERRVDKEFNRSHNMADLALHVINTIAKYEGGIKVLFVRYAELMTRGAAKYEAKNWMKAEGEAELRRFYASAERHFYQWWTGNRDEDHAAAVVFNLNGYQYVLEKLEQANEITRRNSYIDR